VRSPIGEDRDGGRRENMTREAETEFLLPFLDQGADKYNDAFLGFRQIRLDLFRAMGLVSNRIPVLPFPGGAAFQI